MNPPDRLAQSIEDFERAYKAHAATIASGILAGHFDQEHQQEVMRLRVLLSQVRGRLYQVVARVRTSEGRGPLRDDLLELLDKLAEGVVDGKDVSGVPRDRQAAAVRVGPGPGSTSLRGVRDGNGDSGLGGR